MELLTAARPYARAAFACARREEREDWAMQLTQLAELIAMPELKHLVDDPRYSRMQIGELLIELLRLHNSRQLSAECINFIRLLAERGRLGLLPDIAVLFARYWARSEQRVEAEVVSAMVLDESQQVALQLALERRTGKKVQLDCRVDSSLLGGAVVRADGMVIDGSLRNRLQQLSAVLSN